MAKTILSYEQILQEVYDGWPGKTGEERRERVKNILDTRLENYNKIMGYSKEEILIAFEKIRNVNCTNFYQESKFPILGDGVFIFDSLDDFKKKYPSGLSVCPSCGNQSRDYYECTHSDCDWKVYGLFGDLGKGIKVLLKDVFLKNPVPVNIFRPIEETEAALSAA